jgi:hypothetical protein
MRKFQRAAVVAVAVAGLSVFGAGVSFAGEGGPTPVTAVANSSANAVAFGGGYYAGPPAEPQHGPHGPQGEPQHGPQDGPPQHGPQNGPEQAY